MVVVLANMGEYGQPSSTTGIPDEPVEEDIPEKAHAEKEGEENLPVYDDEMEDTNQGQSVPKTPEEILDEEGADLRASHKPSAEAEEIKKLRKKQQRLLGTIARLRQQIRILKANLRIQRTARKRKRATAVKSRRTRRRQTYSRFVGRNPIRRPTAEEQTVVPNDIEEQIVVPSDIEEQTVVPSDLEERMEIPIEEEEQQEAPMAGGPQQPFIRVKKEKESKETQTEAPPSRVIRVLNSKKRNRKVEVKFPASTALWKKDPKTRTLHKMMKQAQQEAEQLREQTVPRDKYEELQQQLRDIS